MIRLNDNRSAGLQLALCILVGLWAAAAAGCGDDATAGGTSGDIECSDSSDCDPGERCERGSCRRATASTCNCGANESCIDGRCEPADTGVGDADDGVECLFPGDCDGGQCINNQCVYEGEDSGGGGDDPAADTAVDQGGLGDDAAGDLATADTGTVDTSVDTGAADVGGDLGECEGREDGRLGQQCDGASDCCNGLCLGLEDVGFGICTDFCSNHEECNPAGVMGDLFCIDAEGTRLCTVSDYGDSCEVANDCTGEVCNKGFRTTGCSWQCRSSADCPPGSACGLVFYPEGIKCNTVDNCDLGTICEPNASDPPGDCLFPLLVCAPVGNSCAVDEATGLNDCLSQLCVTSDDSNSGYCTQICDDTDPDACPFGYACEIVQDGFPAICNPS